MIKIINGDCLEVLKTLLENSVDSIVTDPPAGISFMGKSWDTDKGGRDNWIKWMQEVATECKRVLKPGGHAFVWAIPRTSHWTATAWENAGFEIRDVVAHIFGSGFPKSHNIGVAVAKLRNEELKEVGDNPNHRESDALYALGFQGGKGDGKIREAQNEWSGWGSALKPAREDWILMRKPLEKGLNIAENCLKWGTGGINIDQSRVITPNDEARKQKILAGEVICNAFCDKHGLYPSSFHDIISFSPLQLLDFLEHTFSEQDLGNIAYISSLRNLGEIDYKNCKQLLGVPCDYGRLEQRVDEYVRQSLQSLDFLSDYPTLYRLCGVYSQSKRAYDLDIFPLDSDVRADIHRFLSLEESILLCDNNLPLVFVLVCLAYSLLVNNNLHNHYTTCKNKIQAGRFPSNLIHDNSEEVRECFPETKSGWRNKDITKNLDAVVQFGAKIGYTGIHYEDDNGGNASRFFKSIIYQAKASKRERNAGCEELYILKDNTPKEDIDEIKHLLSI